MNRRIVLSVGLHLGESNGRALKRERRSITCALAVIRQEIAVRSVGAEHRLASFFAKHKKDLVLPRENSFAPQAKFDSAVEQADWLKCPAERAAHCLPSGVRG